MYINNIIRVIFITILVSSVSVSAMSIDVGASYNEVIQKLGEPDGNLTLGSKQILTYGDAKITLRDQKVIKVSPELKRLLAARAEKLKKVQAMRDANLIHFRGEWVTPDEKKKIIQAEADKRTRENAIKPDDGIWFTDFAKASALAKSQNKQLLLDFTGSDWCGWCIRLDNEVFSKPEFERYAQQNYVLVKLDFPRRKQLSAALQKQNNALAKKYKIRGYPTIIVLTSSGEFYKRSGYVKGGPEAFIQSLR